MKFEQRIDKLLFENKDEVIRQIDAWIAKQYQKQVYSNPLDDMDDEFEEDELLDLIQKLDHPYLPLEPYIKNNPKYAYYYARGVIKGRWPEGEEAIKQNAYYAYYYAEGVIKGRWPEGEDAIKQDAEYAYYYAFNVIEGRWPEGEDVIKQDVYWWNEYKKL